MTSWIRAFMLVVVPIVGCGGTEGTDGGQSGAGDDGISSGPAGPSTGSETANDESSGGSIEGGTCFQRFGEAQPYDARLVGSDFAAWDGETARVVVNSDGWGGQVYAVMETTIQNGSFDLLMPETLGLDYTAIGIYFKYDGVPTPETRVFATAPGGHRRSRATRYASRSRGTRPVAAGTTC